MILVDDQAGSKDLYPFIKNLTPDAIMTRIDPPFGDCVWVGNGPDGQNLRVGVEYKKADELLDSMIDGRFAGHQAGGLIEHFDRRYLLVEGRLRTDRNTGVLQKLRGERWADIIRGGKPMLFRDLEGWYTTIEEQGQFRIVKTYDQFESARWVVAKHRWYTEKGWDEHRSLLQFHEPAPPAALLVKPNVVRRIAKELRAIGWDRSAAVASVFQTVRDMVNAPVETWASILVGEDKNGHKISMGKNRAKQIVNEINGVNR